MSRLSERPCPLVDWPASARLARSGGRFGNLRAGADVRAVPRPLPEHAGLWLDRCLAEGPERGDYEDDESKLQPGRRDLYRAAVEALRLDGGAAAHYESAYERWQRHTAAAAAPAGTVRRVVEVEATDRILLHPATDATVTGTGLLLHHVYGVPYLPGSALKGVCRARARWLYPDEPQLVDDVFGPRLGDGDEDDAAAGTVDFFDALWIPTEPRLVRGARAANWSPLAVDVVNPHHPGYYTTGGDGDRPPPDGRESPRPVLAMSIAAGARFRIVVEAWSGPGLVHDDWLSWVVDEVLLPALEADGIGARTAAGYGRLRLTDEAPAAAEAAAATAAAPDATGVGASQAKSPPKAAEPEPNEVADARIRLQRNDGSLHATLADGRKADATGAEAAPLRQALSDQANETLKRGRRPLRARVELERVGTRLRIARIIE